MPISFRGFQMTGSSGQDSPGNMNAFLQRVGNYFLNTDIHVMPEPQDLPTGYRRVYFSRGSNITNPDFYLDLKVGGTSPGGTVVFADTKKTNTPFPVAYGQLQLAPDNVRQSTLISSEETFRRYIEAVFKGASTSRKTPQELIWDVAQTGRPNEGVNAIAAFPAILTPSAPQVAWEKVSKQVPVIGQFKDPFEREKVLYKLLEDVDRGLAPNLEGLRGYTLNLSGQLVPAAMWMKVVGGETQLYHERGSIEKQQKSPSMEWGSGEMADVAFSLDPQTGKYRFLKPKRPTTGEGYRKGFIQALFTQPGERVARNAVAAPTMISDLVDVSGGVQMATQAGYHLTPQGRVPITGMGSRVNLASDLGIKSLTDFQRVFGTEGNVGRDVSFMQLHGLDITPSRGSLRIGTIGYGQEVTKPEEDMPEESNLYGSLLRRWQELTKQEYEEGKQYTVSYRSRQYRVFGSKEAPTFKPIIPVTVKRRDYSLVGRTAQMFLPRFRDPTTGAFSNVGGEGFIENTDLAEFIKSNFGENIRLMTQNINGKEVPFAGGGSGREGSPAGMYMVVPAVTNTQNATKGGPFKSSETPGGLDYFDVVVEYGDGKTRKVHAEYINPEAKMAERLGLTWASTLNVGSARKLVENFLVPDQKNKSQLGARDAILDYMDRVSAKGGNVVFNSDYMAGLWRKVTGDDTTTQGLFGMMLRNAMSATKDKQQLLFSMGLSVPTEQWMKTQVYSKLSQQLVEKIIADEGGAEYAAFEDVPGTDKSILKIKIPGRMPSGKPNIENIPPTLLLNTLNFQRTEITSRSPYVNAAGVMALVDNQYGKPISALLGLSVMSEHAKPDGTVERVYTPTGVRGAQTPESSKAWFNMMGWASYQRQLKDFQMVVPKNAVVMTPELSEELLSALNFAEEKGVNDQDKLLKLIDRMKVIQKDTNLIPAEKNLLESMILSRETYSLVPALSYIKPIEHYGEGLEEGQTETYLGSQYMRYLRAVAEGMNTAAVGSLSRVTTSKNAMLGRIQKAISGYGGELSINMENQPKVGGKQFRNRNITGTYVVGKSVERYQEGKFLPTLYQVNLDDNDLKYKALASKTVDAEGWDEFKKWLDTNKDAYIPEITKRQPDVSGENEWVPVKTVSKEWVRRFMGVDLPTTMGMGKRILISPVFNRLMIGDQDDDIKESIVLPMRRNENGGWGIQEKDSREAFDAWFESYAKSPEQKISTALHRMFGKSAPEFDIGIKTARDTLRRLKSGDTSLIERLQEQGWWPGSEFRTGSQMIRHWKSGMGVSYNTRRFLMDIADTVLDSTQDKPESIAIRKSAYESMSYNYQIYLDRLMKASGGFSLMETMGRTISMVPDKNASLDDPKYGVRFLRTARGKGRTVPEKGDWTKDIFWSDASNPFLPLRALMDKASSESRQDMPNVMMSWLFSNPGNQEEVLRALENTTDTRERSFIMADLVKQGKAGLNSPAYLFMAYQSIRRLQKKHPGLETNEKYMMPWINGEIMPVKDIINTDQFKQTSIMEKLLITSPKDITPDELESINKLKSTRSGMILMPIWEQFMGETGGAVPRSLDQIIDDEKARLSYLRVAFGSQKRVHASELGNLAVMRDSAKGWNILADIYRKSEGFNVIARHLGVSDIMGDREGIGVNPIMFKRRVAQLDQKVLEGKETTPITEPIQMGIDYENQFAQQMKRENFKHRELSADGVKLRHVGQASPMEFNLGGLTLVGTPDFLGYDKDKNTLVIVDTKYAADDPQAGPSSTKARRNVMSYKNRVQQLVYATGLKTLAQDGTEEQWTDLFMGKADAGGKRSGGWGFKDIKEVLAMRGAAREGNIKPFLAPGSYEKPTSDVPGGLKTYPGISIGFGDKEVEEVTKIAKSVNEKLFSWNVVKLVADNLLEAFRTKAVAGTKYGVPSMLQATHEATGALPSRGLIELLETAVRLKAPPPRMAGGGQLGDDEDQEITVGEGGPEKIRIRNVGGKPTVSIVPTFRFSPGIDPMAGFRGRRLAEGDVDVFMTDPPKKRGKKSQTTPEPEQVAPVTPNEGLVASNSDIRRLVESQEKMVKLLSDMTMRQMEAETSSQEAAANSAKKFYGVTNRTSQRSAMTTFMAGVRAFTGLVRTRERFGAEAEIAKQDFMSTLPEEERGEYEDLTLEELRDKWETLPAGLKRRLGPIRAKYETRKMTNMAAFYKATGAAYEMSKREDVSGFLDVLGPDLAGEKQEQRNAAMLRAYTAWERMSPEQLAKPRETWPEELQNVPDAMIQEFGKLEHFGLQSTVMAEVEDMYKKEIPILNTRQDIAERYNKAMNELLEATNKMTVGEGNLVQQFGQLYEVQDKELKLAFEEQRMKSDVIKRGMPGQMFEKTKTGELGRLVETTKIQEMLEAGDITEEQYKAGLQLTKSQAAEFELYQQMQDRQGGAVSRGAQGIARHLLGGWGIFYMGTLAGLGRQQYQEGYQQYTGFEQGLYGTGAKYFGPGVGVGASTEQYYNNMLAMGGNIPWQATRRLEGQLGAAGIGDIAGAFGQGLGASALALYGSTLLSSAGKEGGLKYLSAAGVGLSRLALPIGMTIAAGKLALNQFAYRAAPEETGISVLGSLNRQAYYKEQGLGLPAAWEGFGAWWKGLSAPEAPLYEWTPSMQDLYRKTTSEWTPIRGGKSFGKQGVVEGYYNQTTGELLNQEAYTGRGLKAATAVTPFIQLSGQEAGILFGIGEENPAFAQTAEERLNIQKSLKDRGLTFGQVTAAEAYQGMYNRLMEDKTGAFGKGLNQQEQLIALQALWNGNPEYSKYNFQAFANVMAPKIAGGVPVGELDQEALMNELAAEQAGIGTGELAKGVARISGRGIGDVKYIAELGTALQGLKEGGLTSPEIESLTNTVDFIASSATLLRGAAGKAPGEMADYLKQIETTYGGVLGTAKQEPTLQLMQQIAAGRAIGLSTGGLTGQLTNLLALPQTQALTAREQSRIEREMGAARQITTLGENNITNLMLRGTSEERANYIAASASQFGFAGQYSLQQMLGGNPLYWTQNSRVLPGMMQRQVEMFGGRTTDLNALAISGQDLSGGVNTLGLFQRSLWQGTRTPEQTAIRMLAGTGLDWRTAFGGNLAGAVGMTGPGQFGGTIVPGFEFMGPVGGQQFFQLRQMQLQREQQWASIGNQYAGLQLNKAFTTGVGIGGYAGAINPQTGTTFGFNTGPFNVNVAGLGSFTSQGGGFWGMEDAQRALQRMQTQWGFQHQAEQMAMQQSQFAENMGMNVMQARMQRGWTQQDWGYQQRMREQQWGWRLEDYQENVRFMTGRERRLAERQMRRETIVHEEEGGQIEKQKERQKELWKLEDQRFSIQRKQFAENMELQQEALDMEKQFYEQRTNLEDEAVKMQRAYWVEQMKVQEGAIGVQAKYLKDMQDLQNAMLKTDQYTADAKNEFELLAEIIKYDLPDAFEDFLVQLYNALGKELKLPDTETTPEEDKEHPGGGGVQHGGIVIAGQSYIVGETEPEIFTPGTSGKITPFYRARNNPWNTVVSSTGGQNGQNGQGQITLVVNVGNERLAKFVIRAVDQELNA